jgi:Tfp pilus assembly protein PilX
MNIYLTRSKANCRSTFSPGLSQKGRATQRGVALVITLLMLSLVTVMSLGMVIAFSSQTLIGGYYRNYRGAFYAADSGLNIARQKVSAELVAGMPANFVYPPAGNCPATAVTPSTDYASATSVNTGNAANSWNETFKITNATVPAPGAPLLNAQAQTYTCTYSYSLTSVGSAQGSEQQSITETGNFILKISGQAAAKNVNFAYFGGFVDVYPNGLGPLVPGTMTGPMFTNNSWEFMASIKPWTAPYIFTDPVGQVGAQVDYWDASWGQHWSSATSYGSGANLVAPQFQEGLNLSQPAVPLPSNSFNQVEAVIDGNGTLWPSTQTQAQTTAALAVLQNSSGSAYSGTGTQGIYFNKGITNGTTAGTCPAAVPTPCIAGGGFYVEGGADVQLIPSGTTAQQYKITQSGATTTITIDPAANSGVGTTVITTTAGTQTLNGVPANTVGATPQAQALLFVDGTMTFHGPGEGQGAVQDNAMITLVANGDVIATGDVLYKTEPVTVPQDNLVPGAMNMKQVLGIYTANGNFITHDSQADQNIQVDGSIATISTVESANCQGIGKGGQLSNGHINTFNNVGGMIQSCIFAADVNTENTWFDRRFTAVPGFAPPWFPSTTITAGGPLPTNVASHVQRVQWLNTSAQ